MARKSALEIEVERLNEKYCKHTKNKLVLDKAYGGVQVCLRSKNRKGGQVDITTGHLTPQKTLQKLYILCKKMYNKKRACSIALYNYNTINVKTIKEVYNEKLYF